jgi:hypothetical protein
MPFDLRLPRFAAVLVGALTLAGCGTSGTAGGTWPNVSWVAPEEAFVVFDTSNFGGAASRHVAFTDIWQREEYALFQGNGAQSEIILSTADERDTIILEYGLTVPRGVATWNIARNHSIAWGDKGILGTPLSLYAYQRFQLTDVGRNCFGFSAEWDQRQDDPQFRYNKTLFGYYCDPPGRPAISDARVTRLLDSIQLRGITTRRNVRFTPTAPAGPVAAQRGAQAFARGSTRDTGNPNFPFNFAFKFQEPTGQNEIFPN